MTDDNLTLTFSVKLIFPYFWFLKHFYNQFLKKKGKRDHKRCFAAASLFAVTAEPSQRWLTCFTNAALTLPKLLTWSFLICFIAHATVLILFLIMRRIWFTFPLQCCLVHLFPLLALCPLPLIIPLQHSIHLCFSSHSCLHLYSDPQSTERMEADRSEQGLQFHLPLSFRPKPPRIALQAVKDRWLNTLRKMLIALSRRGFHSSSCQWRHVALSYIRTLMKFLLVRTSFIYFSDENWNPGAAVLSDGLLPHSTEDPHLCFTDRSHICGGACVMCLPFVSEHHSAVLHIKQSSGCCDA